MIRILRRYHSRSLIRAHVLAKIGTLALLWIAISGFIVASSPIFPLIAVLICVFLTTVALEWLERRQIDAFQRRFSYFLDRWAMNIKIGMSPASAKEQALAQESVHLHRILQPIFSASAVRMRADDHFMSNEIANELRTIASASHLALSKLENLRRQQREASEFRRKSGQATLQARIQSVTMLALLFALQVLAVRKHGWNRVGDLVIISTILSLLGVFFIHHLAQKRKWSI